jgi:nitrite reductase/ring-hydroxylating ferredoxin subunit
MAMAASSHRVRVASNRIPEWRSFAGEMPAIHAVHETHLKYVLAARGLLMRRSAANAMADELLDGSWYDVGAVDEFAADDVAPRRVGEHELAVYRVGGAFYATDDQCTHARARLSEGYLQDNVIECPLHQGSFHIPSGRALRAPARVAVRTYPVRVVGGRVQVQAQRRAQ